MNPSYLELVNFRSHKYTKIDLSNFDIAVVVGKNGEGKSSIIYGITYVLWGDVPDINSLSDLVSEDTNSMSATMGFVHDDGNTYKIKRGINITGVKKKTATGHLTLSKELADGTFEDISGNGIDETTKIISNLMGGLTYKTALYSNFNLQGESDKFMQAKPAERRKLFEDILNLKPYETLEKAARAKVKEAKDILRSLDYDDNKEKTIEAEIKTIEAVLQDLKNRTGITQISIESLVKSIKQLEMLISGGTADLETKQQSLYTEIARLRSQSEACKTQIDECNVFIQRKAEIVTKYESLQLLNKQFEAAGQTKQKYAELSGQLNVISAKIQMHSDDIKKRTQEAVDVDAKLENQQKELRAKYSIAEDQTDIPSGLQDLLATKTAEQAQIQTSITGIRTQQDQCQKAIDEVQAEIATLVAEIKAIDAQVEKIEKSGPLCPVFGRECGSLHKDNIDQEIAALKQSRLQKVEIGTKTKATRTATEKEIKALSDQVVVLEKQDKELFKQSSGIEASIKQYNSLVADVAATKASISTVIENNKTALLQLQTKLEGAEKEIALLGFDADKFIETEAQVILLRSQQWDVHYQSMIVAEETIKGLNEKNVDLGNRMNLIGAEIIQVSTDIDTRRDEINKTQPDILQHRTALVASKAEMERLNKETSASSQQLGTLQLTLDQLRTRKNTAIIYQQQLGNYENLAKVYQLARAMILESSTPRFQQFCNDCLDFLGISIRVRIETIEESIDSRDKTVKYNQVFKIIVSGGGGNERDYNTWSGGEKHRINIALRQALAITLLNRSGVKIGLVVIDEGDSKLDENGKDALVQMIEATSTGRFGYAAKVLFVTHAEDLKDRFVTRISVSKGDNGSVLTVQ